MELTLVSDLKIDNVICVNEVFFVVREIKNDKVMISKTTSESGHGMMSLRFSHHGYEDLKNRVMLAGEVL